MHIEYTYIYIYILDIKIIYKTQYKLIKYTYINVYIVTHLLMESLGSCSPYLFEMPSVKLEDVNIQVLVVSHLR